MTPHHEPPARPGPDLPRGTWDETEAWLGRELSSTEGADEVNHADIRRRLELFATDSPLNSDHDIAVAHGYRTTPAPNSMLMTLAMGAYWEPGDPEPTSDDPPVFPPLASLTIPAPGDKAFATDFEIEYGEPVYPGDRISASARFLSMERKTTRVGSGAFLTVETTYRNQDGVVVGVAQATQFRYSSEEGT